MPGSRTRSPEVQVLMPAHNSERYIEHALQSALSQSYQPLTAVVYDDGSDDGTGEILRGLADSAPGKIHITHGATTRGVAHARNQLMAISERLNPQASFLWLDSDDHFLNDRCVETVMAQLNLTDAEICLFNFDIQWEEVSQGMHLSSAVVLAEKINQEKLVARIASAPRETVSIHTCPDLLTGISAGWVKAYTASARRRWPYPVEGSLYEDNPPMAGLLHAERVTAVNEPMVNYRRHSDSTTGKAMPHHFLRDRPLQLRRFMEHIDWSSPAKAGAAAGFIEAKLRRAGTMLDQLVEAHQPGFDENVRTEFNRIRRELISESLRMLPADNHPSARWVRV